MYQRYQNIKNPIITQNTRKLTTITKIAENYTKIHNNNNNT